MAHPVALETYGLFDLGVVDADNDGRSDIFTVTHSGPQSVALNRGNLSFENVFSAWGLDQDAAFPGLAVLPDETTPEAPGLYIGWRGPDLVVRASGLRASQAPITGSIDLHSAVTIESSEGFEVTVETQPIAPRVSRSALRLSGSGDGVLAFRPEQHALPIVFRFGSGVTAEQIFVGPQRVSPAETEFAIGMRDRHGMAWADYDGDGRLDLFITRGGLQGTMVRTPLRFWDELFVAHGDRRIDVAHEVGIEKHGCPGREAGWVDFDRDGRLDLYVVCGRDGGGEDFPNQLFRQLEGGTFRNVAPAVGLDLAGEGKFLWIDDDDDGDSDLVWVDRSGIYRYRHAEGRFEGELLHAFERRSGVTGLRLGDADGDGDDDVFVVSSAESKLLLRGPSGFVVTNPASIGLPVQSLAAAFADVDNSGVDAFFSVPQGLFRRSANGRFAPTEELAWRAPRGAYETLTEAHLAWADFDGDGTRDLLLAANVAVKRGRWWTDWAARLLGNRAPQTGPLRGRWLTQLIRQEPIDNHWLQVDLEGPPGNRQGLGAVVGLHGDAGDRYHAVGHAESSVYSQGHHRVYFGLGRDPAVRQVSVRWPDGNIQHVESPPVDRRIIVRWQDQDTVR